MTAHSLKDQYSRNRYGSNAHGPTLLYEHTMDDLEESSRGTVVQSVAIARAGRLLREAAWSVFELCDPQLQFRVALNLDAGGKTREKILETFEQPSHVLCYLPMAQCTYYGGMARRVGGWLRRRVAGSIEWHFVVLPRHVDAPPQSIDDVFLAYQLISGQIRRWTADDKAFLMEDGELVDDLPLLALCLPPGVVGQQEGTDEA